MANNLETKVNETLPAIKQEEKLTKLVEGASALEIGIVTFLDFYITSVSVLNFGIFSINAKQCRRMENNSTFEKSKNLATQEAELTGAFLGMGSYVSTEYALLCGLYALFGGPMGISTYFGAKAITNHLGYKYYKKQRQIHEELEKIKLLEDKYDC